MKNIKKILCLVLALTMCLSLVNLSALAAEDECPYSRTYGGDGNHSWHDGICVFCRTSQGGKDSGNPEEPSPCQHINYTVIGEQATCEEDGWEAIKCNDCGHEWNQHVCPKTGHSYVDGKCKYCGKDDPNAKPEEPEHEHKMVGKPYGCDDSKCYIYSCEIDGCDYSYTTDHEWVGNFSDGNGDNDTHHRECRVCHAKETGVAHTWSEWKEVKPATEKEEGLESRSCLGCEATQDRPIPVKGHQHTLVSHKGYAPTCTEPGCKDYYCCSDPNCGKTFLDAEGKTEATKENKEIPALGHDLMHCSGKDATCTEAGTKESWVCNRIVDGKLCGAHFTDAEGKNPVNGKDDLTIPALGHEWGPWTHTEDSLKHFRYCKRDNCDCEYNVYPVTGVHNNWEYFTKDPTCTEDGYTEKKCPDCGYTETTVIPAKGHQTKIIVDNEPTCIEKGNEHEVCTVCGVTVENKENPALGHEWGGWQSDGAKGHYQVCGRCESHSDTVDHRFGAWETVTEATTTEEGQEKRVCEDCGHTETRTTSKIEVDNPGSQGGNNTPTRYTLTINYQYADGTKAAEQYSGKFDRNAPYSVTSPEIEGYTPDVTQVIGNMTGNLTVTVTYNANEVNIDEDDPPLADNPEDKDPIDSDPSETDLPDGQPPLTDLPDEQPPLTDLPDEQPPLTDLPTEWPPLEEVSDEQASLAELPDELVPTTDITDDDVPLASAPADR